MLEFKNGKLYTSQRNLNRLYHGTHKPWEILRNEGAQILVKGEGGHPAKLFKGEQPWADVVGVELPAMDEEAGGRIMSTWGMKITTSIPSSATKLMVKECRIQGFPPLVAHRR